METFEVPYMYGGCISNMYGIGAVKHWFRVVLKRIGSAIRESFNWDILMQVKIVLLSITVCAKFAEFAMNLHW